MPGFKSTMGVLATTAVVFLMAAAPSQVEATGSLIDLATYHNITKDVDDVFALLGNTQATVKYSGIQAIYTSGKNAMRVPVTNPPVYRTFKGVAERAYAGEEFWQLAATYYGTADTTVTPTGPNQWFAKLVTPAINGAAPFDTGCCGVRDEAIRAYTQVYPWVYTMHEVDVGIKSGASGLWDKREEIVDGIAILEGGNFTNSLKNFDNALATKLCTSNTCSGSFAVLHAAEDMLTAFAAKDLTALTATHTEFKRQAYALLMRAVLGRAKKAFTTAALVDKAGLSTCARKCARKAHQSAALAFFKALEPVAASVNVAAKDAALAALTSDLQATRLAEVTTALEAIARGLGLNFERDVSAC